MSKRIWFLPALQAYVTTDYCHLNRGGWIECVIELIDNGQLVMRIVDGASLYINEGEEFLEATLLSSMAEHKEAVEAFLQAVCWNMPDLGSLSVGGSLWVDTRDVRDWEEFIMDSEEF